VCIQDSKATEKLAKLTVSHVSRIGIDGRQEKGDKTGEDDLLYSGYVSSFINIRNKKNERPGKNVTLNL
jgi:hypothetical protein